VNWIRSWVRDSEEGEAYYVVLVGEEAFKF